MDAALIRKTAQELHDDISTFESEARNGVSRFTEGNLPAARGIMARLAAHAGAMRQRADILLSEIPAPAEKI